MGWSVGQRCVVHEGSDEPGEVVRIGRRYLYVLAGATEYRFCRVTGGHRPAGQWYGWTPVLLTLAQADERRLRREALAMLELAKASVASVPSEGAHALLGPLTTWLGAWRRKS